jgi:hypothetical protein
MKIDAVATRKRIRSSGRTIAGLARANGIDPARFHHVISNNVTPKPEELDALIVTGVLVIAMDQDKAA